MGKARRNKLFGDPEKKAKRKELKELRLTQKENEAVYKLTCKIMKRDGLTYEQVMECYE